MPVRIAPPYRQIHLDFHTSEHVMEIGAGFDAVDFARTLSDAAVDAIVLFAKCHHGWSYYDSAVGARHPHLSFDLLDEQVAACEAAGIRTTIYISVGWDERAARNNPGWRRILPDGTFEMMRGKNLDASWAYLCCNSPYLDYLCAAIEEACDRYPRADGLWLDIVRETPCCCSYCRADMDERGLDWTDEADRHLFARSVLATYLERTERAARKLRPDTGVFHNSGMVPRGDLSAYDRFSHVEIEALPTGGWGYDHFPISARYIDPTGLPFIGVTGRFHSTWGELGGFKHPNALRAEISTMLSHGAHACIGDHLDPSGVLDKDAYRMIGAAYREIAPLQPIVEGSSSIADVALLSSVGDRRPGTILRDARNCPEDEGALRILLQSHILFDVVDRHADLSRYQVLILPDTIRIDDGLAAILSDYVASGGALLLSFQSGLAQAGGFAIDVGGVHEGASPHPTSYVKAVPALRPTFVDGPFVVAAPAEQVRATDDAVRLAELIEPLFDRTPRHFSGHQHASPRAEPSGYAAALRKGRVVYLAHAVFTHYRQMGHVALRQYVAAAIRELLLRSTVVHTTLPSGATITIRSKPGKRIVQILYAPRELRGDTIRGAIEVIEDLPRLADIEIALDLAGFEVTGAHLVHGEARLSLESTGKRPLLRFAKLEGHVAVVLEGTEPTV
jgi:hypothetical protein